MINTPSVLFFGQKDCQYSQQALEYLKHLGFDVTSAWTVSRHKQILAEKSINQWKGDYILCFRSYFILPKSLISNALVAAINFHPAPTEYPGSGCINWALYNNSKDYGVTAHMMNEKVDNGAIIECRRFPIFPQDNVRTLLERTSQKVFDLFVDISTGLKLKGKSFLQQKIEQSKHEKWQGRGRKMSEVDALQQISITCSKEELERIIRATYTPTFPPEINFHGYKFALVNDEQS